MTLLFRLCFIQDGNRELAQRKEIGPEIILLIMAVTGGLAILLHQRCLRKRTKPINKQKQKPAFTGVRAPTTVFSRAGRWVRVEWGLGAELRKLDPVCSLEVSACWEPLLSPCGRDERDTGSQSGASGRMDCNKRNVATCENSKQGDISSESQ